MLQNISESITIHSATLELTCSYPVTSQLQYSFHIATPAKTDKPKHNFFLVVNAMYGHFPKEDEPFFYEWVEFNRMMGVSEIHMTNVSWKVSETMASALNYYKSIGVIQIHDYPNPFILNTGNSMSKFEEKSSNKLDKLAVTTRLYELMNRFKYMISLDLDELLVPHKHDNYMEMIRAINRTGVDIDRVPSFTASFRLHYRFYNATAANSRDLYIYKYRTYRTGKFSFIVLVLLYLYRRRDLNTG